MDQGLLIVASEANTPTANPQPVLGRSDINYAHHVTVPGPGEVLHRIDHAALHWRVEPL